MPARHEDRQGKIYLVKDCPACGSTEVLVASDASRWREKRESCNYDEATSDNCGLGCMSCNHGASPSLVFLDVTNRCNMNCPICLANVQSMGFRFDPPMAYFEKVFTALGKMEPRPKIQLFGGEPTVRRDLVDIINLAKSYGLSARVVTNGLKMADEAYCRELLGTGTQLMFSFDGRDPAIYNKTRKSPRALELKLKALENIRKHRKSKITVMCCAGLGVNDDKMDDMIALCHEYSDTIAALDLIPLVETWGPEAVDAGNTTIDDVEKMMERALPGVDFIAAGLLQRLVTFRDNFPVGRLTFGGAHPNCESVTVLVSDGEAYQPISRYLTSSLGEAAAAALKLDRSLGEKLKTSLIARLLGRRGRQLVMLPALIGLLRRTVNWGEVFGEGVGGKVMKVAWGLIRGEKLKTLLRRHTRCHNILRVIVLPFEEPANVESRRLVACPASFAYEHPLTRQIRLMPVCAWTIYKDQVLRATSQNYATESEEDLNDVVAATAAPTI